MGARRFSRRLCSTGVTAIPVLDVRRADRHDLHAELNSVRLIVQLRPLFQDLRGHFRVSSKVVKILFLSESATYANFFVPVEQAAFYREVNRERTTPRSMLSRSTPLGRAISPRAWACA